MGHTRLGRLPRTRKWQQVIRLIADGAGADEVAAAVLSAAERGLKAVANHTGLIESFWLLTQLTAAARDANFERSLRMRGLNVPDCPTVPAILAAVSDAVDATMPNNRQRTDLGELAQAAVCETINEIATARTTSLFQTTGDDVKRAFWELGTVKNFGQLAKRFYGRLIDKVIQYYLSREAALHVGKGQRFANLASKAAFDDAVRLHSSQVAVIVEKFAGEWMSKRRFENGPAGISRQEAQGFANHAMTKIMGELREGPR